MSSTDTTDRNGRSSAEIEREVEETRAGLTNTLEELRDRAAPGQLFEQALDYARTSGGAEMVRNLGQSVRDNPLPLVLIGAGIGWLMFTGNQRSQPHSRVEAGYLPNTGAQNRIAAGTVPHTSGPSVTDRASGLVGRAGATAGQLRDSASGAASQASSKAGAALHGAGDAASGAMRSAGDAAGAARDRLAASAHDARDYAYGAGDSARQGLGWLMREQPLVLGAIGVALGAAVGALLPGTDAEDRMMGETRDAVAERAQAAAQEGYERVKETAGEHIEHAKAAAGDVSGKAGGAAGGIGSAVTEAAQQMRHAARDAAHDLAGEARNTIGEGEAKGRGSEDRSDPLRPDQGRTDQAKRGDTPIVGPAPTSTRPGPV